MLAHKQLFDGHFNGEMNGKMITGDSWAATVYAIGSCISHMDTHTCTHTYTHTSSSCSAPQAHGEANRFNLAAVPVMSE